MQFIAPRLNPRFVDLSTGEIIDLPYPLSKEPETTDPQISTLRSLGGQTETQPETAFDKLRILLDAISAEVAGALNRMYWRTLVMGRSVEFWRDPSRMFLLPGYDAEDRRFRRQPETGSTYSLITAGGQYGLGAIGVFDDDPGNGKTNWALNSDFEDGTLNALPTDWAVQSGGTSIAFIRVSQLAPDPDKSWGKILGKAGGVAGGTVGQDMEMPVTMPNLVAIVVSFTACAPGRSELATVVDALTVKISGGDAVDGVKTLGAITPKARPRRYSYLQAMTAVQFPTSTDATLRLIFEVSTDILQCPILITDVQVEIRSFATAPVPNSSIRDEATGSRPANESLSYPNPLAAAQAAAGRASVPFKFTIGGWFTPGWSAAAIPYTNPFLWTDSDETTVVDQGFLIYCTSTVLRAQATLEDGNTKLCSGSVTWVRGTPVHFIATYRDWDGTTASSGQIDLYIGGVLAQSQTHSKTLGRMGPRFYLGSGIGTNLSNGPIDNFFMDAVYLDNVTPGYLVADHYSTTEPLPSQRTGWGCIMDGSQGREPAPVFGNLHNLDLKMLETFE